MHELDVMVNIPDGSNSIWWLLPLHLAYTTTSSQFPSSSDVLLVQEGTQKKNMKKTASGSSSHSSSSSICFHMSCAQANLPLNKYKYDVLLIAFSGTLGRCESSPPIYNISYLSKDMLISFVLQWQSWFWYSSLPLLHQSY